VLSMRAPAAPSNSSLHTCTQVVAGTVDTIDAVLHAHSSEAVIAHFRYAPEMRVTSVTSAKASGKPIGRELPRQR
jgi:hypothetical protein